MHYSTPLLVLAPLVAAGPIAGPRVASVSCTAASIKDFQWTVKDFNFHASYVFTTPAHQTSSGHVNFTLANPALTYSAQCSAYSSQLTDFFFGTVIYNCTYPEDASQGTPRLGGLAQFDYSRPSGLLHVNETWSCADQDPAYPITFFAYGPVNLTLDCTDTTYTNPNWTTPGTIYSDREVTCNPVTVNVKPYAMTAVA